MTSIQIAACLPVSRHAHHFEGDKRYDMNAVLRVGLVVVKNGTCLDLFTVAHFIVAVLMGISACLCFRIAHLRVFLPVFLPDAPGALCA